MKKLKDKTTLNCVYRNDQAQRIKEIAEQIASALSIHGPYNIQFLVKDNNVKVIECNLRSSRSFPFVSKVLGHNFIEEAMHIMLDKPFPSVKSSKPKGYIGVKAPQFSFARLRGADPCLGVEISLLLCAAIIKARGKHLHSYA